MSEYPMVNMFAFENETKAVDESLTKAELLEVIDCLARERNSYQNNMMRRQQLRAANLTNVTPVRTPFLDLVS